MHAETLAEGASQGAPAPTRNARSAALAERRATTAGNNARHVHSAVVAAGWDGATASELVAAGVLEHEDEAVHLLASLRAAGELEASVRVRDGLPVFWAPLHLARAAGDAGHRLIECSRELVGACAEGGAE